MAAHIIKRKDRGSIYYLVDGELFKSLETTNKGIADFKLREYIKGKFGLEKVKTVKQYYEPWIDGKVAPLVRPSWIRDVRLHFGKWILPQFGDMPLTEVKVKPLREFQAKLVGAGLAIKTVRNIVDGSFRSMWRDVRHDIESLEDKNPFTALVWQRAERPAPDPFTIQERDQIIAYWRENDFFYFPWVTVLFHTGMRPSEASALTWVDVDLEAGTIRITKSVYMGAKAAGKTRHSVRFIKVAPVVLEALRLLPSRQLGLKNVFVNKFGEPMNAKKWAEHNWAGPLKTSGIRHRKFYATRHTFITEMIRAGHSYAEVGDYTGTSAVMIEQQYRGPLELASLNPTVFQPQAANSLKRLVAGPGFEPGTSRL